MAQDVFNEPWPGVLFRNSSIEEPRLKVDQTAVS